MVTRLTAEGAVSSYLRTLEHEMDLLGSALPENQGRPPHQLVVVDIQEHDVAWVFFYNSKAYAETGDFDFSLVGNSPLIVDRVNGKLYGTGTAKSIEHYLNEFRRGVRHAL